MKKIFTFLSIAVITATSFAAPVSFKSHQAPAKVSSQASKVILKAIDESKINSTIIEEAPEGTEFMYTRNSDAFALDAFASVHGFEYGSAVPVIATATGDIYFSNPVTHYPVPTWIKAQLEGEKLVIDGIQAIYYDYDENTDEYLIVYLVPMNMVRDELGGTYVVDESMKYEFEQAEDGSWKAADTKKLLGVCYLYYVDGKPEFRWTGYGDRNITLKNFTAELVQLPEGLATESWVARDNYNNPHFVQVGINGSDIYVTGLDDALPEGVAKGTINGDKVTFANGQYQGVDPNYTLHSFLYGAKIEFEDGEAIGAIQKDAIEFTYDATNGVLTCIDGYVVNSITDDFKPLFPFYNVTISRQNRDASIAPAAPYDINFTYDDYASSLWFQSPATDVEGNLLDKSRLYIQLFINDELVTFDCDTYFDLTESTSLIPYTLGENNSAYDFYTENEDHTFYLYQPNLNEAYSFGIRNAYLNENDEWIYSRTTTIAGPSSVETILGKSIVSTEYYNINGYKIANPKKGVTIVKTIYNNGTVSVSKLIK